MLIWQNVLIAEDLLNIVIIIRIVQEDVVAKTVNILKVLRRKMMQRKDKIVSFRAV